MLHREVGNTIGGHIAWGFLLQILSFIVLATLLGAAYAVTMTTTDKISGNENSRPRNSIELTLNKSTLPTVIAKPSQYERRIIHDLERKISSLKKQSNDYDMKNTQLMGKLELLTVKNRALSNQLCHLEDLAMSLTLP